MKIDAHTSLYGVVGCPIKHSKSPLIFNEAFKKDRINAVYVAFDIDKKKIKHFLKLASTLNIKGLSVTLPYKEELKNQVDQLSPLALEIEAINTVIFKNGITEGYNFDGLGAISALKAVRLNWLKEKILILGAGGAARGISITMAYEYGHCQIDFCVRNKKKSTLLQKKIRSYGCECQVYNFDELSNLNNKTHTIIINTTPIGMFPNIDQSPISSTFFDSKMFAYDIIYNPLITKFLKEAKKKGATILDGRKMFINQASMQYQLWTNKKFNIKKMIQLL